MLKIVVISIIVIANYLILCKCTRLKWNNRTDTDCQYNIKCITKTTFTFCFKYKENVVVQTARYKCPNDYVCTEDNFSEPCTKIVINNNSMDYLEYQTTELATTLAEITEIFTYIPSETSATIKNTNNDFEISNIITSKLPLTFETSTKLSTNTGFPTSTISPMYEELYSTFNSDLSSTIFPTNFYNEQKSAITSEVPIYEDLTTNEDVVSSLLIKTTQTPPSFEGLSTVLDLPFLFTEPSKISAAPNKLQTIPIVSTALFTKPMLEITTKTSNLLKNESSTKMPISSNYCDNAFILNTLFTKAHIKLKRTSRPRIKFKTTRKRLKLTTAKKKHNIFKPKITRRPISTKYNVPTNAVKLSYIKYPKTTKKYNFYRTSTTPILLYPLLSSRKTTKPTINQEVQTYDEKEPVCTIKQNKFTSLECSNKYYECVRVLWWIQPILKKCADGEAFLNSTLTCVPLQQTNCTVIK